uniref:CUB domain-containing protein n=1 Tax=Strongyloides stercoralis TaxID=6248 RepID=A0A0K0EIC7_STRER
MSSNVSKVKITCNNTLNKEIQSFENELIKSQEKNDKKYVIMERFKIIIVIVVYTNYYQMIPYLRPNPINSNPYTNEFKDIKSGFNWLLSKAYSNSFNYISKQFLPMIGDECSSQKDCIKIEGSQCISGNCKCMEGYHPDFETMTYCKPNPTFNEICYSNGMSLNCQSNFICNNYGKCSCLEGQFLMENKCVTECPQGYINSIYDNINKCFKLSELNEKCTIDDQCITGYSYCNEKKVCDCIDGTTQNGNKCIYKKQCPVGNVLVKDNVNILCTYEKGGCPKDSYCQKVSELDELGYCCPSLEPKCPVGKPLIDTDCRKCPKSTHYCFSFEVGSLNQSLCCPSECAISKPIRFEDKCYSLSGHGRQCTIDQQCATIKDSACLLADNGDKICQCQNGYILIGNECIKRSVLGEDCEILMDCKKDSNTICHDGVCQCPKGFMPEPMPKNWNIKNPTTIFKASHCIKKPYCPKIKGSTLLTTFIDCSDDDNKCGKNEFCYNYWKDLGKKINYSVCCPSPKINDYKEICQNFGMKLVTDNVIRASQTLTTIKCMLPIVDINTYDEKNNGSFNEYPPIGCPSNSHCIFNPFGPEDEGICCKF